MVTLTQRAQQRLVVLNALERGELVMAEAASLVGLSVRQLRRLRQAYRRRGVRSLVHGNRGRPSSRRVSTAICARVIRLARTTYAGVNHRHLTELLAEREDLRLSHPTVHRILRAAGLRSPRRRRPPKYRQRRERMRRAGMLVQMDGSHHPWVQERGPAFVLSMRSMTPPAPSWAPSSANARMPRATSCSSARSPPPTACRLPSTPITTASSTDRNRPR